MYNGAEIQANLRAFVAKWLPYVGTERSEAQTFLNELFLCFGSDRSTCGAKFEDSKPADGIMDLYWDGVCIIEMKAPNQWARLSEHRKQALDYWASSADLASHREQPPYVVLCSFNKFEIFEPGRNIREPLASFDLSQLPDHFESLNFLAGRGVMPLFGEYYRELTTEAAKSIAELYHSVRDRDGAPPEEVQRFVLQVAWCLFAEDLGMLSGHPVQRIIEKLIGDPTASSYAEFGALFDVLNDPADYGRKGILSGTTYVNGSLFEKAAKVHLMPEELTLLRTAAEFDWRGVDPTIFGSLMEGCLGRELRWKLGAHYTYEADIIKIVGPTVVRPWRERIDGATTPAASLTVLHELCAYKVLDPACGCGNFLYVAYRELRQLEFELKQRIVNQARSAGLVAPDTTGIFYPLTNLQGIEIEPIVAQIARITLWMGHKQVSDRLGAAEHVLPLVWLSSIVAADALRADWPETDVIIGNPPFLGASHVRSALGDAYVEWLASTYKVGIKDLCVYWFRRTQDHLRSGQRAGLVGTNSISQNLGRSASLEYLTSTGGVITDAVSTQKWPGDAKVHVSIVNWVKAPATSPVSVLLDGIAVADITAELRTSARSTGAALSLAANAGFCFEGPSPKTSGFLVTDDEAGMLRATEPAVLRPYLDANDIGSSPGAFPTRWTIDFGLMPLEEALAFPLAYGIVKSRVLPARQTKAQQQYAARWWQFGRPRPELRQRLVGRHRYVAATRHGKRLLATWVSNTTLASDATNVFAFDDDYSMGILLSKAHDAWAWSRSSTIKGDLRYTPTTVFMTFPWPDPVDEARRLWVAAAAETLIGRRTALSLQEGIGLTTLYNRADEGAYTDLKALHGTLDEAVVAAYGWPRAAAQDPDQLVQLLAERNREISTGVRGYAPFPTLTEPGQLDLGV